MGRGSILLEDAQVLSHQQFAGAQHVLRLAAPGIAARALPGAFVHLRCGPALPLRRPLSIMRANTRDGSIECLYKVVGRGTAELARREAGEILSALGPIGTPFSELPADARPLLVGGGVGIPPMIFLAERLKRSKDRKTPLVLMGSEVPFPFTPRPSAILVEGMAPEAIAAMPLLEDWGVPSRLASRQGVPGCFDGVVTDLARHWLQGLNDDERRRVHLLACGPEPMLRAAARLAADYELRSELCLEEYMACGVGGCAGCTVRIMTAAGPAMRRVCVDGPVFPARAVYPEVGF